MTYVPVVFIGFGKTPFSSSLGLVQVAPESVFTRDAEPGPVVGPVSISVGRIGNAPTTLPTQIDLAVRNEDGAFSPRNPESPYYGQLRPGMPVQIVAAILNEAEDDIDSAVTLATAYVDSPDFVTALGPQIDELVPLTAFGILAWVGTDRLDQSSMFHYLTRDSSGVVHYWPCEDSSDATKFGLRIREGSAQAAFPTGDVLPASDSTFIGSLPLPRIAAGASITAPSGAFLTDVFTGMVLIAPEDASDQDEIGRVYVSASTSGTIVSHISILVDTALGHPELRLKAFSETGTNLGTATAGAFRLGEPLLVELHFELAAGDLKVYCAWLQPGDEEVQGDPFILWVINLTTANFGGINSIVAGGDPAVAGGHIWVASSTQLDASAGAVQAASAFAGEFAGTRAEALMGDAWGGLGPWDPTPGADWTDQTALGPRRPGRLLDLLREIERTDHGVLAETPDGDLQYTTRRYRYNADPVVLSFESDISDLLPMRSDRYNQITVENVSGATGYGEETDGPYGSDRSDGIGPSPAGLQVNLDDDDHIGDHVSWVLAKSTADADRYVVLVDLAANESLITSLRANLLVGTRIRVTDVPSYRYGPYDLELVVEGWREIIDATQWLVELHCDPYQPFDIGTYGTGSTFTKRRDTLQSTTAEALDTTETGVDITNSGSVWWDAATVPYDIVIGGERMTVTAVSGSGSSQTMTVTRSVNGVVKSHASGVQVRIAPELLARRGL